MIRLIVRCRSARIQDDQEGPGLSNPRTEGLRALHFNNIKHVLSFYIRATTKTPISDLIFHLILDRFKMNMGFFRIKNSLVNQKIICIYTYICKYIHR